MLLLGCIAGQAQSVTVVDASFETPTNLNGGWGYLANDGAAGGWRWSTTQTNAGIVSGGGISGQWTSWVNVPPNGTQAAFLQNNATLSQVITIPVATNYLVNFNAAHRRFGWPTDNLTVQVDGTTIGYWSSTNFPDDNFVNCSATAYLTAGAHTLSFVGAPSSGDSAIAIDVVTVGAFTVLGPTTLQSDGSLLGTQAAVNNAQNGWTVLLPAGSFVWNGTLTVNKDLQLMGAGIGQTIINDGGANATTLISWTSSSNFSDRLSGFTFQGTTNNNLEYDSTISIAGNSHAFRVDNCKFDTLQTAYNLGFSGWVYGVVDHCAWNINGGGAMQIGHENYGGGSFGDGSWADADSWGTTNALYIESCSFANYFDPSAGAHGAMDSENGARFVFRFNQLTNCLVGSHGSESGGRLRSIRTCEIYGNNFYWDTNASCGGVYAGMVPWGIYLRGGTATIFSNNFVGGIQYPVVMADYRAYPNPFDTWNNLSGVNPWDSNNPALLASGIATGTSNAWPTASVQDNKQNWTPNIWTGDYLYDTNLGVGFVILSNSPTALYICEYNPYAGGDKLVHWTVGDGYQIHQISAAIDQCGRGRGDLIAGVPAIDTVTGVAGWPNEAADPIYIWKNNVTLLIPNNSFNAHGNSQSAIIQSGRDWIDDVPRPGYTNLYFPHPLVVGSNLPIINPSASAQPPPVISTQPQSQTVQAGASLNLAVAATGVGLGYTWLYNNTPIVNATASTLTLPAAQLTDAGNYAVIVANPYGRVTSSTAVVTVSPAPPAVTPPTGLSIVPH